MGQIRRILQDPSCVLAESLGDLQYLRDNYTVSGNPQPVESPIGKALSFNGVTPDYVAANSGTRKGNLISTEDFSVCCLIKNNQTLAGDANAYTILSDKETSNLTKIGWALRLHGGINNGFTFRINDGGQVNDLNIKLATSRISLLSDNKWHFLAVTADRSGDALLYVDDFAGESGDISGQSNTLSNDQDMVVGVYGDKATQPFTGSIANRLFWKRIITPQEVSNLATGKAF